MKYKQSKYAIDIAKWIIYHCGLDYINHEHILFMRKPIDHSHKPCEIFRLDATLVEAFGFYYMIEIYPTYDLDLKHMQYRNMFHLLQHIPRDYQSNNILRPHQFEAFDDEHLFDENFERNLGVDRFTFEQKQKDKKKVTTND